MAEVNWRHLTFVEFVSGQHLDLFVEARGKEEIAKGAVEVLTRIQSTGTEHGLWLEALGQASGWQQDTARLLQAIAAYEMCCDKIMKIPEGTFEDAVDWVQDVQILWEGEQKQDITNFLIGGYIVYRTAVSDSELSQAGAFARMMLAPVGLTAKIVQEDLTGWQEGAQMEEGDVLKALAAYEKISNSKMVCGKVDTGVKIILPKVAEEAAKGKGRELREDHKDGDVEALTQRVKELEAKLAEKDEFEEATTENIKKFLEKEGLPKWMTSLCGSVIEYLDSNENSKGDALARQAWGLIRESQHTYSSRYGSFIGGRKNGPRASPGTGIGQPKNKKSGIPVAKIVAEGGKTFYEDTAGGRFKVVKLDDVVYYMTKGKSLCCDIAGPPPSSRKQCGKAHWIWDCPDL